MANLNRDELRAAFKGGVDATLATLRRLGYKRGRIESGEDVITNGQGDWVFTPCFSMREQPRWWREFRKFPLVPIPLAPIRLSKQAEDKVAAMSALLAKAL